MKNKFKLLWNADDKTIDNLSDNYFNISSKEKDRMFAMSEKKVNDMKANGVNSSYSNTENERLEIVTVEKRSFLYKPFRAAGVCFALVLVVAAVAAAAHRIGNGDVDTFPISSAAGASVNENISASAENETAFEESSLKTTGAADVTDEDTLYDGNFDTGNTAGSETSSAAAVSSSPNKKDDIESIFDSRTTNSGVSIYYYHNDNKEESENKAESSSAADLQEISDPYIPFTSQKEETISNEDDIEPYGTTTEKKVLGINSDMSYDEAIKSLGEPETLCITNGYAQFIVDDTKLLMIHYTDKNDLIGIDGSEILAGCADLSELVNDPDNFTFEGYVIFCDGTVRVTCPQYTVLGGCTDLWFSSGFDKSVIKAGDKVKITYTGDVMESYPPIIDVTEIIFE